MNILHGTVILLILQGVNCIKFLIHGGNMACVIESTDQGESNKCFPVLSENITAIDYDYQRGSVYNFISNHVTPNPMILMSPLNFTNEKRHLHISRMITKHNVLDISLDWVNEVMYVVHDSGKILSKADLINKWEWKFQGKFVEVDSLVHPKDLAEALHIEEHVSLLGVQVDPYEQLLFLHACIGPCSYKNFMGKKSKNVILRSDLSGNGLTLTIQTRFTNDMKFYIDVNEKKIYITDKFQLFIYDYNGVLLGNLALPRYEVHSLAVFNKTLYLLLQESTTSSFVIHRQFLNDNTVPVEGYKAYKTSMSIKRANFKLLDARSRRRLVKGRYICDRTDCPDECAVLPEGDTCVCKKSRAKTQDGLTCYDCGQSSLTTVNTELTIVRGHPVSRGEFPWYTILYEHRENEYQQICGGTLISSSVVLTAAHCVTTRCDKCAPELMNPANLMVTLGRTYRDWNKTQPSEIRRRVKEIRPYEDYMGQSINYAHDIALLLLESKVPFSRFVMPACLDYNLNQLPPHQSLEAYVPGLGFTEECGSTCSNPSERLKYTKTNVISFLDCFKTSQSLDGSLFLMLTPDRFCTGNGSESPVQKGDSGGGLTLVHNGLHYVTGVVSIKFVKLRGSSPSYSFGAFTNVSDHITWIKENIPKGE